MFQRLKELVAFWDFPSPLVGRVRDALPFWGFPAIIIGVLLVVLIVVVAVSAGGGPQLPYERASVKPASTAPAAQQQFLNAQPSQTSQPAETTAALSSSAQGATTPSPALSNGSEVPGPDATFVFKGYGRAHGVGLCMDGVMYRAQAGQSYMSIINYYYTGVTLGQVDDSRSIRVQGHDGQVHTLSMKEYLSRLVEEPDDFPAEGLKVLYVAARTYALNVIARGKHAGQGFDICSSGDCCQAFDENKDLSRYPNSIAAINATAGQVLLYNGSPIDAAYCGSCGGHTENNEDVWGGQALPYLRGKPDPYCANSPRFCTTKEISVSALQNRFGVGQLKLVDLSDRTPGGRVRTVRIVGTGGTKVIKGKDLASILGFKTNRYEYSFK